MDAQKNKRLLLAAGAVCGLPMQGKTPGEMMAVMMNKKQRKTDPPTIEKRSDSVPPPASEQQSNVIKVLDEMAFKQNESKDVFRSIRQQAESADPAIQQYVIDEVNTRWNAILKSVLREDDMLMTSDVYKEHGEQAVNDGWTIIISYVDGSHHLRRKTTPSAAIPAAEKDATSIIEDQDTAYAIAQVEDFKKDEAARVMEKETVKEEAVDAVESDIYVAARRRLMDWLIVNDNPREIAQMLGVFKIDGVNGMGIDYELLMTGNGTRFLATKLAHAVFPSGTAATNMSVEDKMKASKPVLLWSDEDMAQFGIPVDEATDAPAPTPAPAAVAKPAAAEVSDAAETVKSTESPAAEASAVAKPVAAEASAVAKPAAAEVVPTDS